MRDVSKPTPNGSGVLAIERVEFGLRLLAAILIIVATGFVLLELSVRFGVLVDYFD